MFFFSKCIGFISIKYKRMFFSHTGQYRSIQSVEANAQFFCNYPEAITSCCLVWKQKLKKCHFPMNKNIGVLINCNDYMQEFQQVPLHMYFQMFNFWQQTLGHFLFVNIQKLVSREQHSVAVHAFDIHQSLLQVSTHTRNNISVLVQRIQTKTSDQLLKYTTQ